MWSVTHLTRNFFCFLRREKQRMRCQKGDFVIVSDVGLRALASASSMWSVTHFRNFYLFLFGDMSARAVRMGVQKHFSTGSFWLPRRSGGSMQCRLSKQAGSTVRTMLSMALA